MARPPVRRLVPLALLAGLATPAFSQLPPLTVPKGLVRVELSGRFEHWSRRYLDGEKEEAAGAFIRSPADGRWLPTLAELEARLTGLLGTPSGPLSLGSSTSAVFAEAGTGGIGLAFGLTGRVTLFGSVPFVRVRTQSTLGIDSAGGTLGINPAHPVFGSAAGQAQAELLLTELGTALATLSERLQAGAYDADPARKALAQATLTRGQDLRQGLSGLLTDPAIATPFLPLAGSASGAALATALEDLRTTLATGLGIAGFTATAPLPDQRVNSAEFLDVTTRAGGPFAFGPLPEPIITSIGDIELGAAFRWLDVAPPAGLAVRSTLLGTVRLPTGYLDRPDRLFDLGVGERQLDIEGAIVADLQAGRVGARLTGRYVQQLAGTVERRVTSPDQPIVGGELLRSLERDPGEVFEAQVEPFLRIAPTLSVTGGARWWSKGEDRWTYAPGVTPVEGADLRVLGQDSKERALALALGVSYVHSGRRRDGTTGRPMDAALRYEWVAASSAGIVPARRAVSLVLRFYR
ncbi:MAG: hypothetical protein ACRENB_03315 [Gemmatimonadales bacterium]